VRIKYVVLKMARRCYVESMRQPCEFFWIEDSDLAHYLLPCLVVALLGLLQDSEAKDEHKKWCLHFVDRLITTFEMHDMEITTNRNYINHLNFIRNSEVKMIKYLNHLDIIFS
jgi:hypothetical protein